MDHAGIGAMPQSKIATVLRVTSGNFLEMFDFVLFGFYASYISKALFPGGDDTAKLLLTFMTLGAGFLMRPLGALILCGYIDRIGRRRGLTFVTAYPALPWLVQDIAFPHMLIVLLWLSFLHGSYNGAMVVALTEVAPVAVRTAGFSLAYSLATAMFGGFTAAIALIEWTHDKAPPAYGWPSAAAAAWSPPC